MMRALYTAASGMMAQQMNIDNVSNNLANYQTTGYKTNRPHCHKVKIPSATGTQT